MKECFECKCGKKTEIKRKRLDPVIHIVCNCGKKYKFDGWQNVDGYYYNINNKLTNYKMVDNIMYEDRSAT